MRRRDKTEWLNQDMRRYALRYPSMGSAAKYARHGRGPRKDKPTISGGSLHRLATYR